MGLFKNTKRVVSAVDAALANMPKWARIIGVQPEDGRFATIDLEIHWGYGEAFLYSARWRLPTGVQPKVGQDVAIRRLKPDDTDASYSIDWDTRPQYGPPTNPEDEQAHPASRLLAAKRAHDQGALSDTEFARAKQELQSWADSHFRKQP